MDRSVEERVSYQDIVRRQFVWLLPGLRYIESWVLGQ